MHTLINTLSSTFSLLAAAAATTTATSSAASSSSTIDVHVGQNNQLTFSPSSITAAQGSTINFHFYPANHSVAESLVRTPCRYTRDGIWSGYVPVSSGAASTVFSVTLNDTNARWLYSAQRDGDECQGGMVMVINPPDNQADTLDAYIKAASIASNSTNGHVVMGGLLVENASSSSSSSVSTQVSVTVASGTTGSGTAGSTTGTSTATGSGTTGSGTVGPTTAAATSTGSTGTTAATTSATTGAAAGATSTGAANAQGYKNSVGIGAGALLLGIWYYL